MKKIIGLLILLYCAPVEIIAQDWNLFKDESQKTYYSQENSIHEIFYSSMSTDNNMTTYFFNNIDNSLGHMPPDCEEYLIEHLKQNYPYDDHFYLSKIHKVFERNGMYGYVPEINVILDTFWINPLLDVGEFYETINGEVTIICTSIYLGEVHGVQDSIKTFDVVGHGYDEEFILSKKFGLIKFLPFYAFYSESSSISNFNLIGLEYAGNKVGITSPEFKDYFPLQPGDMTFWENDYSDMWTLPNANYTHYFIDSIISRTESLNEISFTYKRTHLDENYFYLNEELKDDTHNAQTDYRLLLKSSNKLHIPNEYMVDKNDELTFETVGLDTVITHNTSYTSLFLYDNSTPCSIDYALDANAGNAYSFNNYAGYIYYRQYGFSTYFTHTLIGSFIGGVSQGNNIVVGASDITLPTTAIYPNPVNDILNIQLDKKTKASYTLYNMLGQIMKIGKLNDLKTQINVIDIDTGIYYLKIDGYNSIKVLIE